MSASAAPNRPNLADQLPADAYYQLIHSLLPTLPPPLTDSPEDLARRNHAVIARIAALAPANAAEADIAALYVAASEQWKECLRLAQLPERTVLGANNCRAQASSMMRQAQSALRLLLRMQAARRKLEANNEACDRAAWTEHCAIALMAEALSSQVAPAPITEPPEPPPLASEPQPEPEPAEEPRPALLAAVEHDTSVSPRRAALIRLMERLAEPPDKDLVQSLITALSPLPLREDRAAKRIDGVKEPPQGGTTPALQFAEASTA